MMQRISESKSCEFVVQPTPNMSGPGGSAATRNPEKNTPFFIIKNTQEFSDRNASTGQYKTAAVVAGLKFTRNRHERMFIM